MGRFAKKIQITRGLLITAGLIAALYYVFAFRALSHQAESLDGELEAVWEDLTQESFVDVNGRLDVARDSVEALTDVEQSVTRRILLDPSFEKSLKESFQLVDFEIERETRNDELIQLAAGAKVTIPADPFERLPEYTTEMGDPRLLWGQMAIAYHVLVTTIDAGVDSVDKVDAFVVRSHGGAEAFLDEITFEMTLTGSMSKISKFLKALPMDRRELERHELKSTQPVKPAFFIDGLMLRKRPGKNFDDVRLDLRVGGFIYRERVSGTTRVDAKEN